MKHLEVIHLRTAGGAGAELARQVAESLAVPGGCSDVVQIYRRAGLDSDVAIHIHIAGDETGPGPSALGLHLASALRAYGLVEHSVWEKLR